MDYRRCQAWVLGLVGLTEMMAIFAVIMPHSWMSAAYEGLGFGGKPQSPVFDSVMRQVSFMYFTHGVALCFIAADVVRYRPLVWLSGIGYLAAAPVFLIVDLSLGMPWWWWASNSGACLLIGVLLLGLLWAERKSGRYAAAQITI